MVAYYGAQGYNISMEVDCASDLDEKILLDKLRRAGGADYDGGGRTTGAQFGQFKAQVCFVIVIITVCLG